MSTSRYSRTPILDVQRRLATPQAARRIKEAARGGSLAFEEFTLAEGQRLDQIAQASYGDGRLWWVIAAASGIGWWLQVPPGTRVIVPTDINAVMRLL
jgi:hypothetical protein